MYYWVWSIVCVIMSMEYRVCIIGYGVYSMCYHEYGIEYVLPLQKSILI